MNKNNFPVQIRWSDIDANLHLRHSVYYDWGALCRIEFLNSHNLTMDAMRRLQIGPVIFREECVFRKEIKPDDKVTIDLVLGKAKKDFSRWTIKHRIIKEENILCATLTVDGAWINITERKLTLPPELVQTVFSAMPKDENFEWIENFYFFL
jgi:acyl-CoA thioester hydrolase